MCPSKDFVEYDNFANDSISGVGRTEYWVQSEHTFRSRWEALRNQECPVLKGLDICRLSGY
jgi:hypothetical protein